MNKKILEASILAEFPTTKPCEITHDENESTYKFQGINLDDCYDENGELNRILLIARQDGFFWNVHNIKRMIENCGFNATLNKKPITNTNKQSEAIIHISY